MKTYAKTIPLGEHHVLFNVCEEETQKPLAVAILDLRNGQIGNLLVDSQFREQGIGTKLIITIEAYAEEKGLKSIHVITHSSNVLVRDFFKKRGYAEWIKIRKKLIER